MGSAPGSASAAGIVVGRYVLYDEIASGGMASVHIGRLLGPAGFSRTVAIKRLHALYAKDPAFVAMFLDEARLAARIRHPNVVSTLDVATMNGEIFLVMDYVQGDSLSKVLHVVWDRQETVPGAIASSILVGVLYGLDAAHDATDERGEPLRVVHRDVSPQNILVGIDGIARVADFGIAKAVARLQTTGEGQIKGKVAYMSPEQLRQGHVDRRADVFTASIVLWEVLTGRRLFASDDIGAIAVSVLSKEVLAPSRLNGDLPPAVDEVVLRGLAREPADRFATARDMLLALERALPPASPAVVGDWVKQYIGGKLERRALRVSEIERSSNPPSTVASGVMAGPVDLIEQADAARVRAALETVPIDMAGRELDAPPDPPAPGTQVTDASLVTPVGRKVERRHAAFLAAAVAAAAMAITIALSLRGGASGGTEPSLGQSSPSATTAPDPSSEANPAERSSSSAAASAASAPTSNASPATTHASSPVDAPRKRPRPAADCDPPYVFDAVRQIRVYKKQCQ
jgi:serine/threonine protein kinase